MKKVMPKAKAKPKVKAKKIVAKLPAQKVEGKLVGRVAHFFSDINVGVIKLSAPMTQGDHIRIVGGENTDFNQSVVSMQIEHEVVKKGKKGDSVGMKVKEKVRDGYKVYVVKK